MTISMCPSLSYCFVFIVLLRRLWRRWWMLQYLYIEHWLRKQPLFILALARTKITKYANQNCIFRYTIQFTSEYEPVFHWKKWSFRVWSWNEITIEGSWKLALYNFVTLKAIVQMTILILNVLQLSPSNQTQILPPVNKLIVFIL